MEDSEPPDGTILWQLLLLIVLIFVNAFFAASEIAVITLNDNKIKKMAEDGDRKAARIVRLTQNSSDFLATIQIGVTLAGFLTSALAAQSLAEPLTAWLCGAVAFLQGQQGWLHGVVVVLITLIMSYFSLVLGELVPKKIAMQRAEKMAFAAGGILQGTATLFKPFVRLLSASTNLVVRLLGFDPHADEEQVTEEEIRMMVDVGEEKGVIEEAQKDMINNIFEFDDINAEDIMTPRTVVEALKVTDPLSEALRLGVETGYSRLPVYQEDIDHVIGILCMKDLLPYVGQQMPAGVTLQHLLRPTLFVPCTKRCGALFSEMTAAHIQMAVVVDEYGGMAGIVTMEDLLESIVGSIQDEYDNEQEEVTRTGDNSFEVDASADLDEVREQTGVTLPEGEYDTLGGFLLDRLGRIPAQEERPSVQYEDVTFTVLSMEDRRIGRVKIEKPQAP